MVNNAVFDFYAARRSSLQCSDTVGWASGRASGVGTGGSGGSMNRGPELGPRVVEPQIFFRQDS